LKNEYKKYGAETSIIDLNAYCNWSKKAEKDKQWKKIRKKLKKAPSGKNTYWGIPFAIGEKKPGNIILASSSIEPQPVIIGKKADYICFLHQWEQLDKEINEKDPHEGQAVGEYILEYGDGTAHTQIIRARFEIGIAFEESPGPPWLAVPCNMYRTFDPTIPPGDENWGVSQFGSWHIHGDYLVYAMGNPKPDKKIKALKINGLKESPIVILGITLYNGKSHPLKHLPRKAYKLNIDKKTKSAEVDLGLVTRTEETYPQRNTNWLKEPGKNEKENAGEVLHIVGAEDATVSVKLEGERKKHKFSLGEAYHKGKSTAGDISLSILDKKKIWLKVNIIDSSTGRPTPVRIHFSGKEGRYIAPYGHHEQVNTNWFEDYGADVRVGGRNFAYVPGTFTTDLPVGDIYAEISKGFEYKTVRQKINIKPDQKELNLYIDRWTDLRSKGWVTADTHVHFISPHTAWLEGRAEGVNVINLLASQWGRLFTNVGDYTGKVGIVEDDTIVYVGTENRNHMLGHMSMLGTKGDLPVYPMCSGQPTEAYVGDTEFMMLADWALENKRKGGLVIRPHYPDCGHTEDPVPIIKGLVDALEVSRGLDREFPTQEWYRYLNCGYKVAVCGGTDKMGAYADLGWLRTYALLDKEKPFTYDAWAGAVRAGRTISTSGPLLDLYVDGRHIGDSIKMGPDGGTVEVQATASSFLPINSLEVIYNGKIIAAASSDKGESVLNIKEKVRILGSGWIAARCKGGPALQFGPLPFYTEIKDRIREAHTSPVYIKCGDTRAFDGPAAEHMLALVEGGIEYLNTIATMYDEAARKRMVKQFKEVQEELKIRLVKEADHTHHHGNGHYHTHGHGADSGHEH
jgi:hypothetical protein